MRKVATLAALVLVLAACGRKGPPLPPIIEVPETTTNLTGYQDINELVLRWKFPSLTRSGRTLTDLARIEVFRLEVPAGQEAVGTGQAGVDIKRQLMLSRSTRIASLEGESLKGATRGENLEFRDTLPAVAEGTSPPTFWYAVRTVRRDRTASALSNIVAWQRRTIPPAVTGLMLEPEADGITVSWDELNDVKNVKYVAERRSVPNGTWEEYGPAIVDKSPQKDPVPRQGLTWRYRIRALVADTVGPISPEVEVKYRDVYPPPPAVNFICLPEPGVVRMRWDASSEAGVVYKVFRRKDGGKWIHLTAQATTAEFDDVKPQPGSHEYAVKAVDEAGNESEALYCTVEIGP